MSMKPPSWLRPLRRSEPELPQLPPLWFGNRSNGEFFRCASQRDRHLHELVLRTADENARKVGLDRRSFLASALGMCTTLFIIDACSSNGVRSTRAEGVGRAGSDSGGAGAGGTGDAEPRGRLCVPREAMFDESVACETVGGNEFIFDVQTHWFKPEDLSRFDLYRQAFGPVFAVANEDNYIRWIFCESDTTVAALTSWPGVSCDTLPEFANDPCGLPLDNSSMAASRERINQLALNTRRVVNHVQVMAQDRAGVEPQLRIMEQICADHGASAWKLYPGAFEGFFMDDEKGRAVIEKGLALDVPIFCVHKGLQVGGFFQPERNHPRDIGVVARDYPAAQFVVYHSAICAGHFDCTTAPPEGPFDPDDPNPSGSNALVKSLLDNGIGPNQNVYAELGSALNEVQADPTQAAHFLGKLMKYVGVDNVLWGTDCVIYGSPQPFIEWFRTVEIPEAMQAEYGYPPLDATNRAKIFGLNAARLYGIDPEQTRCRVQTCDTAVLRRRLDEELGPRRWALRAPRGPKTLAEYWRFVQKAIALRRPG